MTAPGITCGAKLELRAVRLVAARGRARLPQVHFDAVVRGLLRFVEGRQVVRGCGAVTPQVAETWRLE